MPSDSLETARPTRGMKPGEEELRRRLQSSVEQMLELVTASTVSEALSAPTGFDAMSRMLDDLLQEHPEVALVDRDLTSDLRLLKARRDLLQRAGGTYGTAEVADLLGLSREAVRKRIERGRLLSYKAPSGEHRLPRAQFSESGTMEGLETVLEAMHVESPWMRIQLFLDDDVIGSLRDGRVDDAVRAVNSYLPPVPEEG